MIHFANSVQKLVHQTFKSRLVFFILSLLFMISCTQPSSDQVMRKEIVLSGEDWQFVGINPGKGKEIKAYGKGYPEEDAIASKVPGDVHWDLARAGKIPYVYYGMNTRESRWVTGKEWWYRKVFQVPDAWKDKTLRLRFDAVDYKTEVWLNGHYLGQHEGQFIPFEFELSGKVNFEDENILTLMIHPVPEPVRELISLEWHEWKVIQAMRHAYPLWKSMTSSGWDWGANLVSMGIWQDVRLIATQDVYLSNLTVLPEVSPPYNKANLHIKIDVLA